MDGSAFKESPESLENKIKAKSCGVKQVRELLFAITGEKCWEKDEFYSSFKVGSSYTIVISFLSC
jgi:hypothetical protein